MVPDRLRDVAFAIIGCSLGSGFTPAFLDHLARWPASLVILCVLMLGVIAVSSWILVHFFGQKPGDAVLATSPGALSLSITLAMARGTNPQAVMVFQTLRLILITVSVPLALSALGDVGAAPDSHASSGVPYVATIPILAVAVLLGALGARWRVPASYLLGGMLISGGLHLAGLVVGLFPQPVLLCGLITTGSLIGARFSKINRTALRNLAAAATCVTGLALALSAGVAWLSSRILGLPFGQVWVAYAPGGVEAMAAMGLSLHYDPAFIATHHLTRIVLMLAILPPLAHSLARYD